MSAARMKQRLGWEAPRRAATLRDFQLVFDQAGFNDLHGVLPTSGRSREAWSREWYMKWRKRILRFSMDTKNIISVLKSKSWQLKKKIGCGDLSLKKIPRRKASHPGVFEFLLEGKSFLSREYFDELSRIQVILEDFMKQEHLPESS